MAVIYWHFTVWPPLSPVPSLALIYSKVTQYMSEPAFYFEADRLSVAISLAVIEFQIGMHPTLVYF